MSLKGDTFDSAAELHGQLNQLLEHLLVLEHPPADNNPLPFLGRGRPPPLKEEADGGALICPSRDL